ncbi:hypothetical protein HMPREF0742_02421 [Rothia aeria F0184]|uniref:Uncharacterized protein n=1 Tax=Rothia aeria F0184 TaxID=888019 RepID=U7UX75_9MICC|nr:hypothetical protein HMPREF0742_02421 [Rothia aeria F0184]
MYWLTIKTAVFFPGVPALSSRTIPWVLTPVAVLASCLPGAVSPQVSAIFYLCAAHAPAKNMGYASQTPQMFHTTKVYALFCKHTREWKISSACEPLGPVRRCYLTAPTSQTRLASEGARHTNSKGNKVND